MAFEPKSDWACAGEKVASFYFFLKEYHCITGLITPGINALGLVNGNHVSFYLANV